MAAAQTNSDGHSWAEQVLTLSEELKGVKEELLRVQNLNAMLVSTNSTLVMTLSNRQLDMNTLVSKTTRISVTNDKVKDILASIELYPGIQTLLNRDMSTSQQIQEALTPLIHGWSTGVTLSCFLPGAIPSVSKSHARPVFSFLDILPYIDANHITMPGASSLLWRYSYHMYQDSNAFQAFRSGTKHKSALHCYISMVATVLIFNVLRVGPILYPLDSPIWCSYQGEEYRNIMDKNKEDLIDGQEPIRPQEEELFSLRPHGNNGNKNKKKRK